MLSVNERNKVSPHAAQLLVSHSLLLVCIPGPFSSRTASKVFTVSMSMVSDILQNLRQDPPLTSVTIDLSPFQNQSEVLAVAQAIHGNDFTTRLDFDFDSQNEPVLN